MAVKYKFKGHESFILREGWLTKGLVAVHDDPKVFSKNKGADALGVGTNMANAIKYWLLTAGFIAQKQGTGYVLTELGELIYEKDRYFEDIFSLWLFHINTASNFSQATTWNIFFDWYEGTTFTRREFIKAITALCYEATGAESLPENSIESDCGCLLAMYSEDREESGDPEDKKTSPFAALGLLGQNGSLYEKKRPSLEIIDEKLVFYLIQEKLLKEGSIGIDEAVDGKGMPGKLLSLSRVTVNDILDRLAEKGCITVNRTAGLDMIYKASGILPNEIIKEHYEGK